MGRFHKARVRLSATLHARRIFREHSRTLLQGSGRARTVDIALKVGENVLSKQVSIIVSARVKLFGNAHRP
jgi:hypothetical protein